MYVCNGLAIKELMKAAIANGEFNAKEVIRINISTVGLNEEEIANWNKSEIAYEEKMYDVISSQKEGDKIIIQCLCDDDENNLIAAYEKAMHCNHKLPGKSFDGLDHSFPPFIVVDNVCSIRKFTDGPKIFPQYQFKFTGRDFQNVPTPPPWLATC